MSKEVSIWGEEFPHDYAHAVGVLALHYNALELSVYGFFQRYAPGSTESQAYLYGILHNQARREFVTRVSPARDSIAASDAVLYAMKCFDACSENRNLLLHATHFPQDGEEDGPFMMAKIKRREPHTMAIYDLSLEEIRAAADSARDVGDYVIKLLRYFSDFEAMSSLADMPDLPTRPAMPRRLTVSERPQA